MKRLGHHVTRALANSQFRNQVFSAYLGETTREDFIPYTADFLLQIEDVKWTIVSGVVGGQLIVSVRNLGYSRNAGEFVKATFGDIGSAGGHRAMAKAVVPLDRFQTKFGDVSGQALAARIGDLAEAFLSEAPQDRKAAHDATRQLGRIASPLLGGVPANEGFVQLAAHLRKHPFLQIAWVRYRQSGFRQP